jgi:toxin ParE1/3/4
VKRLIVEDGAAAEFEEAASRYEAENRAVAWRFVQQVLAVIDSVHRSPGEWPLAPTVPERFGVRRRLVAGFPFSVVYKETDDAVWVVAVAHGKRRPGYWRKRMSEKPR